MKRKLYSVLFSQSLLRLLSLTVVFSLCPPVASADDASEEAKSEKNALVLHSAVINPLDWLGSRPKNLVRWNMGSTLILWEKGGYEPVPRSDNVPGDVSNLLSEDFASVWQVAPGEHAVVVDLGDNYLVTKVVLEVLSGTGKVQWYTADALLPPGNPRWRNFGEETLFSGEQSLRITGGPNQARFILIKLSISAPTALHPLGLYGNLALADIAPAPVAEPQETLSLEAPPVNNVLSDIAAFYAGGRVLWISDPSKAPVSNLMLADEEEEDGVDFPPDNEAIWIVALAEDREIVKTSIKLESPPGTLSAYMMSSIPDEWFQEFGEISYYAPDGSLRPLLLADAGGTTLPANAVQTRSQILLASEIFNKLAPAFVVQTTPDQKIVEVMIPQINARYVLFRWVPAPGSEASGKNFKVIRVAVYALKPEKEAGYRKTNNFLFSTDNLANSGITGGAPTGDPSGEVPYIPPVSL